MIGVGIDDDKGEMCGWFNTTAVGIGGDDRGVFISCWYRWCWWPPK